jgi:hypothetical protein
MASEISCDETVQRSRERSFPQLFVLSETTFVAWLVSARLHVNK